MPRRKCSCDSGVFGDDREAGLTFLCFKSVLPLCVCLCFVLFVVNIAVTVVQALRFLWLPLRTWTKTPGWRPRKNVLSWREHFIKSHLFSALVRIIVFKPSANNTDSSSWSIGCSQYASHFCLRFLNRRCQENVHILELFKSDTQKPLWPL